MDQVLRDFRKYTAQQILKIMENKDLFLKQKFWVNKKDRKYQVWKRDPNFKNIYSWNFLRQKMEYIHNNPTSKGWRLSLERADYKYSSACFYDEEREPIIEIDDVVELFEE